MYLLYVSKNVYQCSEVSYLNGIMGYGSGMGMFWNLFFNILLILLIVGAMMLLLSRSGYGGAGTGARNEERFARVNYP